MSFDIRQFSRNLRKGADGIWYGARQGDISYPDDGNTACYQVEDTSYWFLHRNECIAAVVKRYPPPGTIFDVGGGNGVVSKKLLNAGFGTALVEPGPSGARNALERGVDPVVCARLEDVGFTPGSLPAVGVFDVVEHIGDDHLFLLGVRKLLAPGGMLYVTVPAFGWLWSSEDDLAGHFRRYTDRTLRRLLTATGFEVVYSGYLFSMLPLPILLLRSIPARVGLRTGVDKERVQTEHTLPKGPLGRMFARAMSWEQRLVAGGRRVPIGSSCIAVARVDDHVGSDR